VQNAIQGKQGKETEGNTDKKNPLAITLGVKGETGDLLIESCFDCTQLGGELMPKRGSVESAESIPVKCLVHGFTIDRAIMLGDAVMTFHEEYGQCEDFFLFHMFFLLIFPVNN